MANDYYRKLKIKDKVEINKAIADDLDRTVAHLARVHRVTQKHIIEIMEIYSQNELTE
jgi:hypothetical protein